MRTLRLSEALIALFVVALVILSVASAVFAVPHEPEPNADFRALRPGDGHIETWYIYNDSNTNGILDPGDTKIALFDNWWTPVSAHTQHNYDDGPYNGYTFGADDDRPSGPMNFATNTLPDGDPNKSEASYNYWLPREKDAIHFYMSYSQFDNNDWEAFSYGSTPTDQQIMSQRNMYRNGWNLGWVTNDFTRDQQDGYIYDGDQSPAGHVEMDMYVHEGEHTLSIPGWGKSRSNPQVAMSNDINSLAQEGNQWQPPQFDEASQSYSWFENAQRMNAAGLDAGDLATIVGSMEFREVGPSGLGSETIWPNRTPQQIINSGPTDHLGMAYIYEDAFLERSDYVEGSTDGGVIAGLSGWDDYEPGVDGWGNWGDQQVIRIDISPETLQSGDPEALGNISKVVFYDFGYAAGSSQIDPFAIVFLRDDDGNLYFAPQGEGSEIFFPENRIYISRVEIIPEPVTLVLLTVGGMAFFLRRRRK